MRSPSLKAVIDSLQVLMVFLCLSVATDAQTASVTTSLLGRIDSKQVKPDSPFFVKVISPWQQGACHLRTGDTLEGRVVDAQRRPGESKRANLQLRFLPLNCASDKSQQILFLLVALGASQFSSENDAASRETLMGAFGAMVGTDHSGSLGKTGSGGMSSATEASLSGPQMSPGVINRKPLRIGEVRRLSGVKLTLPTLTTDPTSLSASHNVLLETGTQFVLVVRSIASESMHSPPATAVSVPPLSPSPVTVPSPPEEPAEVQTCVAGGCVLADSPPLHSSSHAERRFSLRSLGYRTRSARTLQSLAEDAAVRFLGEDQLLVVFDAHPLIPRSRADADHDIRVLRALLISTSTGKIVRAQDWRIEPYGPYLWPLTNGRLLAHIGNALIVYGPGLKVERQWPLSGELVSLHISPSGKLLVAAVMHERHTPDEHQRLTEFLGPDRPVAEDYDLIILDDQLKVKGTKRMTAQPDVSQVLDSGLVFTEPGVRQRWNIFEIGWNDKRRDITKTHSACPLRVETLPTDLILLVGCAADAAHSWYSIIHANGQTLMDGATPNNEWLEGAEALTGGRVFAIGIVEATEPIDFIDGMPASDFQQIIVSVYSSSNGQRLLEIKSPGEAVNRQSFALSESGAQLAVLSGDAVSIYRTGERMR